MNLQERNEKIEEIFQNAVYKFTHPVSGQPSEDDITDKCPPQSDETYPEFIFNRIDRGYKSAISGNKDHVKQLLARFMIADLIRLHIYFSGRGPDIVAQAANFLVSECFPVLADKGEDYAVNSDAYANFNESSELTGLTPSQTLFALMTKHYLVLRDYIAKSGKNLITQSISERIVDIINYLAIWAVMPVHEQPSNQLLLFPED